MEAITKLPHLHHAALPHDIAERQVLLLDPMFATGGTALAAVQQQLGKGVAKALHVAGDRRLR